MPMPPPRKELSDNPIKICNEISRLFHGRLREARSIDGVMSQPGARLVLAVLALNDGIIQRKLVEDTHLRAPTVSGILKKMEEEGMVERRSGEDRREFRVYLTEYGRQMDMDGIATIKKHEAEALDGISEKEQEFLMELLVKIRNNLLECEKDMGEGAQ
ncbi:MAG: winged helix-turn-helix transcriptional regulator [Clostridia bacterium]|nr:winged helix-turn-helix transcriptional regulator [Clostridia bacterium]